MPLAKSKNSVGLGNSLMNDRFGKGKGSDMRRVGQGIQRTAPDGSTYITTQKQEAAWVKMRSVTEQAPLDEFLATAELAGTDFTAEKMNNVKIIHRDQKNPYLLSAAEERATVKKQNAKRRRLRVPRRPPWDETTTAIELDQRERESLVDWRRGLAELQDNDDLLMTPFERNLEVWRQLWRVIERSDLIVQIVDARNPMLYRCEDLELYVKEVDPKKNNLLLVNKADMMTLRQRDMWARYFKKKKINFRFFSAALARDLNEAREQDEQTDSEASEDEEDEDRVESGADDDDTADEESDAGVTVDDRTVLSHKTAKIDIQDQKDNEEQWTTEENLADANQASTESTRIITTEELESLFLQHAPEVSKSDDEGHSRKTVIGLVGYPNVGKSSTINALIGAKKVSVSATPGKTKHFQTIHLSDSVILCDCPGLVFPNFATTKAELVCNGVLPIDQMREFTGPAALVAQRIPKSFMEAIYGMKIKTRPIEEGGTGMPTGEELLAAYAAARGFYTTGQGVPDESRASRYVLKDYVNGKLLYCHPPPSDPPINPQQFNRELYDADHLPQKRRAAIAAAQEAALSGSLDPSLMDDPDMVPMPIVEGAKTQSLDKRFFARGQGNAHLTRPLHQRPAEEAGVGARQLTGRKLKEMTALDQDIDVADLSKASSKKHFKANKKRAKKVRSEYV